MDDLLKSLGPLAGQAIGAWGVFTILLIVLGVMLWRSEGRNARLAQANEKLATENARLQDLRVQDAREMIRVAESGTATMNARAEGDARFRELITALTERISVLSANRLPPPESR